MHFLVIFFQNEEFLGQKDVLGSYGIHACRHTYKESAGKVGGSNVVGPFRTEPIRGLLIVPSELQIIFVGSQCEYLSFFSGNGSVHNTY